MNWLIAWIAIGSALAIIASIGGWGLYTLWNKGTGAQRAYNQHWNSGNADYERRDYAAANREYAEMISLRPHEVDGYTLRASSEIAGGKIPAAWSDYAMALTLDDSDPTANEGITGLADKTHNYAKAEAIYRQEAIADPGDVNAWGSLGWIDYEGGQLPAAITADKRAQMINPNQGWINYNLALCYAVAGDQIRSTQAYAAALAGGTASDRTGALGDIRNALAGHPNSTALRSAEAQLKGKS